ncbi:MAG: LemA family protein [Gammaproteobacteria bacterium]|nr:LemA family protein [Gammaproteobacteria bacterium]MBL7000235.1 LemA family protein [Gammaproteobacteria bacterium]
MIWLSLAPILFVIIVLIISYNRLVSDKHRVLAGWSDIDVQLKRRHDLIPKLVQAIQQYARYEQATLQAITELRQQARQQTDIGTRSQLENNISGSLFSLYALAENYPDLKSNQNYLDLQQQVTLVEQDIHFARRYFNGAVNKLNTRIETFPELIVARLLRFKPASYFELQESHP